MSRELESAFKIIENGSQQHAFAGAVACVGLNGSIVMNKAVGYSSIFPVRQKIEHDTLFDLASVTKVIATATSVMILVEQKRLDLETRVVDLFPSFSRGTKKKVRVRHLLCHTSGLPAWEPLYAHPGASKTSILRSICNDMPLQSAPGTRATYSDLGYIILGEIVQRASNQSLDHFASDEIYRPLGMKHTSFVPWLAHDNVAATEFSNWRFRMIRGEVHDENAAAMGGVSGHAGLFSTASDLAIFCKMMLNGGTYAGKRILDKGTIRLMVRNHTSDVRSYYGLGWRVKTRLTPAVGARLSPGSYGHNGYTGTSVWLDKARNAFIILLTNRVHPVREGIPGSDQSVGIMMRRRTSWNNVLQDFQNAVIASIS